MGYAIRLLAGACVLAILGAVCVRSLAADEPQASTGTVIGKVVDQADKPAVDCIVTIAQNAEKMRSPMETATDKDGKFKIEKVPEGDWNMTVRTRNLKLKAIKSLSVDADKTTDVGTLKLKPTATR